jgi:hypothetical protein
MLHVKVVCKLQEVEGATNHNKAKADGSQETLPQQGDCWHAFL